MSRSAVSARGHCGTIAREWGPEVGSDAVVAHTSETTMSTMQDTNERRQAIWPWILMPLVVLLVAYTLQRFQHEALRSAAAQPQVQTAAGSSAEP